MAMVAGVVAVMVAVEVDSETEKRQRSNLVNWFNIQGEREGCCFSVFVFPYFVCAPASLRVSISVCLCRCLSVFVFFFIFRLLVSLNSACSRASLSVRACPSVVTFLSSSVSSSSACLPVCLPLCLSLHACLSVFHIQVPDET